MFTFTCPHCNAELEVDDDMIGQVVTCPNCNSEVLCKKQVRIRQKPKVSISQNQYKPQKNEISKESDYLSFFCGFFFSIIGVLIAWGVGGREGVRSAFQGFACSILTAAILGIIWFVCSIL